MRNLSHLEEYFRRFYKKVTTESSESVVHINLAVLQSFDLLNYHNKLNTDSFSLTRYFHVIETSEKITLINDDFIVWIVPEKIENLNFTFTIIALNRPNEPKFELAFVNSGIYNTSRLVLRVLEKFLREIQENEDLLNDFNKE